MKNSIVRAGQWMATAALLCFLPSPVPGVSGQDLFEAEVPVTSQQPAERTAAMKTALSEVLVRVTGQRELLRSGRARALLDDPARYVQQYRYFTVPDSSPPELRLRVRFDGNAVRQVLSEQGVAYWGGSERPDTLVWLAVEESGRRYILSAEDDTQARRLLGKAAQQRGVPLVFPLMDLEDESQVRFSDIQGGFHQRVLAASERYDPQAVLIGRLHRGPSGSWVARWELRVAGNPTRWSDSNAQLGGVLQAGIDNVADTLASRLAVSTGATLGNTVTITVQDINTLTAYARVTGYLASLTTVNRLQVQQVAESSVQYALQLNGTLQGLTQTIAIGSVLEPLAMEPPGSYRVRQ
jgi:hypothetical protein